MGIFGGILILGSVFACDWSQATPERSACFRATEARWDITARADGAVDALCLSTGKAYVLPAEDSAFELDTECPAAGGKWVEVGAGGPWHREATRTAFAAPYVGEPTDLESAALEASGCDAEYESCYAESVAPGVWRAVQVDCDSTPNGWGCQ